MWVKIKIILLTPRHYLKWYQVSLSVITQRKIVSVQVSQINSTVHLLLSRATLKTIFTKIMDQLEEIAVQDESVQQEVSPPSISTEIQPSALSVREDPSETYEFQNPWTDCLSAGISVRFTKSGNDTNTYEGRILGYAGNSRRKYDSWFNVEYSEPQYLIGENDNFDWSANIESWERLTDSQGTSDEPEKAFECTVSSQDLYLDAKLEKLGSWSRDNVYDEVLNAGQEVITVIGYPRRSSRVSKWLVSLREVSRKNQ